MSLGSAAYAPFASAARWARSSAVARGPAVPAALVVACA
jgi:hypothetical protein